MKAKELINILNKLIEKYGDKEIQYMSSEYLDTPERIDIVEYREIKYDDYRYDDYKGFVMDRN